MSSDNIKLLKENQKSIYPQTLSDAVLLEEDSDKTLLEHIEENFATKDEAANNTTMMNKVNVALAEFKEDVLEALNDVADTNHEHDQYALKDHKHDEYLTRITSHFHKYNDILFPDGVSDNETLKKEVEKRVTIDYFNEKINEKANLEHAHPEYADYDHSHDSQYASLEHDHDAYYSKLNHNHDELYMPINKTFDDKYSKKDHNHDYNDLINTPDIPTVETIKNSLDLDRYDEIIDNLAHLVNEVDNASKLNNVNIDKLQKDLAASANKEHTHLTEEIIVRPGNDDAGEAPIYLKEFLDTKADSSHVHNLEDLPNSILTIEKNKEMLNSENQFTHKHSLGDIVDLLEYPVDGGNDRLATHSYVDDAVIEGMSSIDYVNITGLEERLQQTESIVADNTNSLTQMDNSIRNDLGEVISKNTSDINDIVNILPKREQMEDEDYLEPIKLLKEIAPVDHHHEYEDLPADIVSIEKLDGYVKPYVESEFSSYTENVLKPTLNSKLEDYSTIDHIHEDIAANITSIESSIDNIDNKVKTIEENNIAYQEDITKKLEEYTLKDDFDDRISYIQTNFSAIEHNHDDMYALKEHEHDKYADKEDVYSKTEIDTTLDALKSEINIGAYATKEEVVQQLESKADLVHTHEEEFTSIDSQFQEIGEKFKEYTKSSDIEKMVENTVAISLTNKVDKTTLDLNYQTTQVSDLKYAKIDHTHAYSPLEHNHDEKYSLKEHLHENTYYTQEFIKENYSLNTHKHDDLYSNINHSHDNYALLDHNHDDKYLTKETTFDDKYSKVDHKHEEYALKEEASKDHDHDDKYAKIEELAEKANIDHVHEEYAEKEHEHGEYVKSQDANEMFAPKAHEHEDYALAEHIHEDYLSIATAEETYATKEEVEAKSESGHTHEEYATKEELKEYSKSDHLHEEIYATKDHEHIIYAKAEHVHEEYALVDHNHDDIYVKLDDDVKEHTHEEYALKEEVAPLEHDHDDKYALIDHTHDEYAALDHEHSNYVLNSEIETIFDGKFSLPDHTHENYALKDEVALVDHTHDEYAAIDHTHENYALSDHTHENYATLDHTHENYATVDHNHDKDYAPLIHEHKEYAELATLKGDYYTKLEIDDSLKTHNHDGEYYKKSETFSAAETELKILNANLGISKNKDLQDTIDEINDSNGCGCTCSHCQQIIGEDNTIKGVTIDGTLEKLFTAKGADINFNNGTIFNNAIFDDDNDKLIINGSINEPTENNNYCSIFVSNDNKLEPNLILANDITEILFNKIDGITIIKSTINTDNITFSGNGITESTVYDPDISLYGYVYECETNNDNVYNGVQLKKEINSLCLEYTNSEGVTKLTDPISRDGNFEIQENEEETKTTIIFFANKFEIDENDHIKYNGITTLATAIRKISNPYIKININNTTKKIENTYYEKENETTFKLKKENIIIGDKIEDKDSIYLILKDEIINITNCTGLTANPNESDSESILGVIFNSNCFNKTDNNFTFKNDMDFKLVLGDKDGDIIGLEDVQMSLKDKNLNLISAKTTDEIKFSNASTSTQIKISDITFANLYSIVDVRLILDEPLTNLNNKLQQLEEKNIFSDEFETKLEETNNNLEELKNELNSVEEKYKDYGTSLDDKVDEIENTIDIAKADLDTIIEEWKESVETFNNDLDKKVDSLDEKIQKSEEKIDDKVDEIEDTIDTAKADLDDKIISINKNLDDKEKFLDEKIQKSEEKIDKKVDDIEDIIDKAKADLDNKVDDIENTINVHTTTMTNLKKDFEFRVEDQLNKQIEQFKLEKQDFIENVLDPKEILMSNKLDELNSLVDDFNYSCDDKISEFSERLTETEQSIEQERTVIKDELTSLKDKYLEELDNKVEDLTDSITKTEETLSMTLDEADTRISEVVSVNIETLNNKVNEAQEHLEAKKTEIESSLQGKVEELTSDVEKRIIAFGTEYEKAIGGFTDDYTNTISSFNEEVNKLYSEHETKLNNFSDDFTDSYETKISEFKSEVENLINTHDANLATSKAELETYIETEKAKIDESVTKKCNNVIEEANEIANKNIENITVISSDLQDIVSNAMVEYDEQISEKFNEVNDKIDQFEYQYQSNSDNLEYKIEEYDNKFKDYDNNINELSSSINSMIQESEKSINDTITNFDTGLNDLIKEKTGAIDSKITEFTGTMNQTINDFREEHLINVSSLVAQKLDDFQYNVLDEFESEVDSRINEIPSVDLYKSVFDETVELKVNPVVESLKTMKEEDLEDMSKSISELTLKVEGIKSDAISDLIALDVMTKDMIQQWLAENPTAHSHSSVHIYASEEENVEGSPRAKYFYYIKSETDNEIDESQRDYFDPSKIELEEYDPERKRLTIDKVYAKKIEVTQKINSAKRQIYTDLEAELADKIKENIKNNINDTIKAELNNTLVSNYARYNYDEFYQRDENGQIVYGENGPVIITVDSIENMMKCMKANASNHAHANYATISELLNVGETSLINRNYYTKSQVDGRIQQKVDSSMTNLFNNKVNEIEANVTNNISEEIQNNYVLKSELEPHLEEFNSFKDIVALKTHNHDTVYATKRELAEKANFTHNHDGVYAKAIHEHPEYAPAGNYVTKEEVENNMVLDGVYARVDSTYTKDVVYTKAETDALMSNYHADFLRKEDAYNKTDIDSLIESIREDINNVNQIPDNLYTKQEVLDLINSAVEHLHDDYTQRLSTIEERLSNLEQ